jgi:hypothetical protein
MCEYTFHPEEWESEHYVPSVPDTPQPCPVPSIELSETEKCVYHADSSLTSQIDRSEESIFADLLQDDRSVFGALFTNLTLTREFFEQLEEGNYSIRNAVFDGEFEISEGETSQALHFNGCVFSDYSERNSSISGDRSFVSCRFEERCFFRPKQTTSSVSFNNTKFSTPLRIRGNFQAPILAKECDFDAGLGVKEATIQGEFQIRDSDIRDDFLCGGSHFDVVRLDSVRLPVVTAFSNCNIDEFACLPSRGLPSIIDFRPRTTIHSGTMNIPDSDSVYYDFAEAEIGDVMLEERNDLLKNYYFENTKFSGFDFIDHESQLRRSNYNLHEFAFPYKQFYSYSFEEGKEMPYRITATEKISGPNVLDHSEYGRLKDHEETYARAQTAANAQGANKIASEMFKRQQRARKERLRDRISRGDGSISMGLQYWGHRVLGATCEYGENPWKPLKWSLLTIGGSALLYPFLNGLVLTGSSETERMISWGMTDFHSLSSLGRTIGTSLYFSVVTFTTLGYGDILPLNLYTRLLASLEALLGAFFIALFVFTLGRQVNR